MKFRSKEAKMKKSFSINIIEFIETDEQVAWKFDEAKKKELKGLGEEGHGRLCTKKKYQMVPPYSQGFVLAIKDERTNQEVFGCQGFSARIPGKM